MTKLKRKCLIVTDDFAGWSIGILVDPSISGARPAECFRTLSVLPDFIRSDNGLWLDSMALPHFTAYLQLGRELIAAGKPNDNADIESFRSRGRYVRLNQGVFRSLEGARRKIEILRSE